MDKKDNIEKPFFQKFLAKLKILKNPSLKDLAFWVWISSTQDKDLQAVAYAQRNMKKHHITKDSKYFMALDVF
jgi:hypothetical protein